MDVPARLEYIARRKSRDNPTARYVVVELDDGAFQIINASNKAKLADIPTQKWRLSLKNGQDIKL